MSGESNCSAGDVGYCWAEFDRPSYLAVAGVRIATSFFSLLCCSLMVGYMVYYKKYKLILNQKLVLFLALAVVLRSLASLVSRINFTSERDPRYCYFAGFLDVFTSWMEIMAVLCISFNLLLTVVSRSTSKRQKWWLYLIVIFLLPLLWCCLPFIQHSYGLRGPWCGIRVLDTGSCQGFRTGQILLIMLRIVPLTVALVATPLLSAVTGLYLRAKSRRLLAAHPPGHCLCVDHDLVVKEVVPFLLYPPSYPLSQIFLLCNEFYGAICPDCPASIILWFIQAFVSPLAGSIIAFLCLLYTENNIARRLRSKLKCNCQCYPPPSTTRKATHKPVEREFDHYLQYGDSMEGVQAMRIIERVKSRSCSSSDSTKINHTTTVSCGDTTNAAS